MSTEISSRLVTITPELAERWLKNNTHNRTVDNRRVELYADDIRRGEWRVNGEAIKLADDDQVLDGQHRLLAVLEADASIDSIVITGLPAEVQETMDQGRPRSFADALKLRGERHYVVLAAATKLVYCYETLGLPFGPQPTIPQLSRTLERNEQLRYSVEFAAKTTRSFFGVSPAAGLHYLFSIAEPESANDFFKKLGTGLDLTADSPIYVLRERLQQEHADPDGGLQVKTQLAFVVKAWNAYMDGDTIQRLIWKPGGAHPEPFPAIRGLAGPATSPVAEEAIA